MNTQRIVYFFSDRLLRIEVMPTQGREMNAQVNTVPLVFWTQMIDHRINIHIAGITTIITHDVLPSGLVLQ